MHTRFPKLVASSFVVLSTLLPSTAADAAVVYTSRATFEGALGSGVPLVESFDGVPVNGSGFAAVGNGAPFSGFTITSLSVPSPIDLTNGSPPTDTGLDGTFLLRSDAGDVLALPGGGDHQTPGHPPTTTTSASTS